MIVAFLSHRMRKSNSQCIKKNYFYISIYLKIQNFNKKFIQIKNKKRKFKLFSYFILLVIQNLNNIKNYLIDKCKQFKFVNTLKLSVIDLAPSSPISLSLKK